jgi:DNA-directed RNA polymerase specialized sigma24 family protein
VTRRLVWHPAPDAVRRSVVGHPLDLRELYDASYGRLVVQVYAFCGNLADAEDAVQGAFVTALRKRSRLALTDSPEAWTGA